jgi:hypothetical protein
LLFGLCHRLFCCFAAGAAVISVGPFFGGSKKVVHGALRLQTAEKRGSAVVFRAPEGGT